MTNKTEMVSVPRELLERITNMTMFTLPDADYKALTGILAAPAQDVRSVGDEAVAEIDPEARHLSVLALHDVMQSVPCSSLYSLAEAVLDAGYCKAHPQRPVVLPDFSTWYVVNCGVLGTESCKNDETVWRACIDEVKRLNS